MSEVESDASSIERRTILKGAAWSVPVIAAAVATPLAAATTPSPSFEVQVRRVGGVAGAVNGDLRIHTLKPVTSGEVLTVTISPVTTATRWFFVQNQSGSDFTVPGDGTGSASGTTKVLTLKTNLAAEETRFLNFNFSGYIRPNNVVTINVYHGATIVGTNTFTV